MKGIITLKFLKVIDYTSTDLWDQHVFENTFHEYGLHAQHFDQGNKFETFQGLLKGDVYATRMHSLVSTAAIPYLKQLNKIIPGLRNNAGADCIPFSLFRFEIVQSHRKKKELHKVAIHFESDELLWIDTIHDYLLLGNASELNSLQAGNKVETNLVKIIPGIQVNTLKIYAEEHHAI